MSKKRDYTRFSKEPTEPEVVAAEVEETQVETPEKHEFEIGIVTDCVKLNVRKEPHAKAEIVCEVTASTDLMIDKEQSTDEFYKICTAAGVEGYCMKKFVTVM